jgi:DNA-binding NarL/FixJ family response regulator
MVGRGIERRYLQDRADIKSGTERREERGSPAGRRQAQLQQAQRLASLGVNGQVAVPAGGQLAAEIAQDFNNLLTAILRYEAFVSAELAAPSGPDSPERLESVRRDLGQIALGAERAASRTCQPGDFVRPAVVHPQVLDLDDVVADVPEMLRQTLAEHVELVTTLAGDLWPVLADPAQQAILSAIMVGAAGYVSKQPRGTGLVSGMRTVASGPSILDPYASDPVIVRMPDRTASKDPAAALTGQEKRVLELIGQGLTNRLIAERMCLAEKTAKNYVSSLLAKLGMHRRAEAAAFAVRHASDHGA